MFRGEPDRSLVRPGLSTKCSAPWPCVSLVPTSLDLILQTALSSPRLPQGLSRMCYVCLPSPLPLPCSPSGLTVRSSVSALWASLPVPSLHPTQYRINPEGAKYAPPMWRRPNWLCFYYFLGFSKVIFKAFLFYPRSAIFLTTENLNGHLRSSPLWLWWHSAYITQGTPPWAKAVATSISLSEGFLCSPESTFLSLWQAPGIREWIALPFPSSLSSVMDQALVCLFWMILWAHWQWGPCLNLWQTLNPVQFSLLLRAHLMENKSFTNHLPYLFLSFLISVSWNCLQKKILVLDSLNQVTSAETQAKLPLNTKSGHTAGSSDFQARAQLAWESQTFTCLLLPPLVWLWPPKAIWFC